MELILRGRLRPLNRISISIIRTLITVKDFDSFQIQYNSKCALFTCATFVVLN